MTRSITVRLPEAAAVKLVEIAEREYRDPREQAALLLVAAIEASARRRVSARKVGL